MPPPVASGSKPSTGRLPAMEAKMVKAGLQAPKQTISQRDLFAQLGLQPGQASMEAVNSLLRKSLVTMLKDSKGDILFKFVAKDEAKALGNMDSEEKLVFDHIRNAGNEGIWTKTLTSSTQLPRTTITKVLKILEGKKTVKTVKSVKNPTRKIYMLANLVPSVELTGGPWFTDNELDTEFVDALKRLCKKIIEQKSRPKHGSGKLLPIKITRQLPRVDDIRNFIDSTGVALQVELSDEHVASLLDLMVYEGSIVKIFYPREGDEDVKPLNGNGKKPNGKSRKRPHESDDSDDGGKGRKKKGKGKSKAPARKKAKRGKQSSDEEDSDEESAESEDIDSDEDVESYRRKKAKLEEEGIETKASKRKKKKRRPIKDEDSDAGSVKSEPSSASESESSDEEGNKKGKKKMSAEDLDAEKARLSYVYRLARPYQPLIGWTEIPCGRCPVEHFCTEVRHPMASAQHTSISSGRPRVGIELERGLQGVGMLGGVGAAVGVSTAKWGEVKGAVGNHVAPVNPKDCKYYKEWFDVDF